MGALATFLRRLAALADALKDAGTDPRIHGPEEQRVRALNIMMLTGLGVAFGFWVVYFIIDVVAMQIAQGLVCLVMILTLTLNYAGKLRAARYLCIPWFGAHFFVTSMILGPESGAHYWFWPYLSFTFLLFGRRQAHWTAFIIAGSIASFAIHQYDWIPGSPLRHELDSQILQGFHLATIVAASLFLCITYFLTLLERDRARREAEAANQARRRFFARITHEINSPLQTILGYAELLHRQARDEETRSHATSLRNSGKTLSRLLKDLLDLARLEEGRISIQPQRFPIRDSILEHLGPYEELARGRGLDFSVEWTGTLPASAVSDPQRIGQILINLAANALKYTDRGAVRFRVSGHPAAGELCWLEIAADDSGVGFSPEERARLFEPFQRLPDREVRTEGAGLGLSIVQELTRLLGGALEAESPSPLGTPEAPGARFMVRLPLHTAHYSPQESAPPAASA